jgi:anti-anti-sigma factor
MMDNTPRRRLKVEEFERDGLHTLVLTGELDANSAPSLEAAISRLSADGTTSITLDLSKLMFIDSSGLWTITMARRWCAKRGCEFFLIPGPESVQRIFEMTGLLDVLPFRNERDGAP